ncbi:hypothetical protein BDQ17DRAFT_1348750 [Cyathus striatus]|nr:hypothetical protein BDQ17DRAFT_1348750 [Cyathus striatus]
MPTLAVSCSALSPVVRRTLISHPRVFRRSSSRFASPTLPSISIARPASSPSATTFTSSGSNNANFARNRVTKNLTEAITHGYNPSRIWSYYMTVINVLGQQNVPLEIHQQVLRHCTAPSAELRVSAPRRLLAGNKPDNPHIHEGRFQSIIRNIRSMGINPSLDDYHFILEQFAAVGHHVGAIQVFKELVHVGVIPEAKTFGLCLQAIAYRLSLPVRRDRRDRLVLQTRKMLDDLMDDMRKYEVPLASVNFDLSFRILKETLEKDAVEKLVKWGYGIDLSNPDRLPLEYVESGSSHSKLDNTRSSPLQFSTSALNTILDVLGYMGDVSRLVQAFEVLTQPLPEASQHLFSSFDDEDDFGESVELPSAFKPPYAMPNTTTYNILLRHLCKLGHATLVRHYILQAVSLDRQTDHRLRQDIRYALKNRQQHFLDNVTAPHFAINRGTLLPALGHSNRDKDLGLMRWLSTKMARIVHKKRADLAFYMDVRERLRESEKEYTNGGQTHRLQRSAFLRPTPSRISDTSTPHRTLQRKRKPDSLFSYNLDELRPPPMKTKQFDIDLHIYILERDIRELDAFTRRLQDTLGRTTQHLKERLGRRVWAGKDIYLATEHKGRTVISREKWREIVGFKPRRSQIA